MTPSIDEQNRIASVLVGSEQVITRTEAVIAKLRKLRAGLLHELLARGLNGKGQVRDPVAHPEQFKHSSIGRIPSEWVVMSLAETADPEVSDSFIDGDWIEAPHLRTDGIRLIQTGNIGAEQFLDKPDDRKFISLQSFYSLKCKALAPGDVLICRLADPVGRACLVPSFVGDAITSVDVTIFRPDKSILLRNFAVLYLNTQAALRRCEILAGGTTRKRISRKNLGRLAIALPPVDEQLRILEVLETADAEVTSYDGELTKLKELRSGLVTDLLTGRVRVPGMLTATNI